MRVIGGAWKGRRLQAPPSAGIRPTTDRVKEAVFNILGPSVVDATVYDLCCGAGGLGIEALSRGAARAVFVDRSPRALAAVRRNLAACGAPAGRFVLARAEAVAWVAALRPPAGPWLALADPPYDGPLAGELLATLGQLASRPGFVAAVIEHAARGAVLPDVPCPCATRRYGETAVTVLSPAPAAKEEGP